MPLGTGWKLNVMESVTPVTVSGTRYLVYNDSDGTDHYFYPGDGAYSVSYTHLDVYKRQV